MHRTVGGGSFPYIAGRIDHGFRCNPSVVAKNVLALRDHQPEELSPALLRAPGEIAAAGHFYCDSLVHSARALRFLCNTIGEVTVLVYCTVSLSHTLTLIYTVYTLNIHALLEFAAHECTASGVKGLSQICVESRN